MAKHKKTINWKLITFALLVIAAAVFFFTATGFIIFPKKYKLPLFGVLAGLLLIMGLLSLALRKGRAVISIINALLSVFLIAGSVFLPSLESRLRNIFHDTGDTEEFVMNVYTFTSEYKSTHAGLFPSAVTSTEISDYADSRFLIQEAMDLENQDYAVQQLKTVLNRENLNTVSKQDILDALTAFYDGEAECLILNEVYVDSIEDLEGFDTFASDTQVVTSITREVAVEPEPEPETPVQEGVQPFIIMIAGEDTRSSKLSVYGRTDVDMVVTVNPNTKQIVICGIPRDAYVKNPALHNGLDKLTHLGNNGIKNTMQGLSRVFERDITEYAVVNFRTFKNIIDALGGIDVDNPYAFSAEKVRGGYHYPEGMIHLNGDEALAYCRERHRLKNGDYGRSEHQTIVLKSIINKLTSREMLNNFNSVLNSLQGQVLISMDTDSIYALVQKELEGGGSWNMVNYHLGGRGDMQPTASMGSRKLYVTWLFQSQIDFIKGEMDKVWNGETITQGKLPDDDKTTYIPN